MFSHTEIKFNTRCNLYDEPFMDILKDLETISGEIGTELVIVANRDKYEFVNSKLNVLDDLGLMRQLNPFYKASFNWFSSRRLKTNNNIYDEPIKEVLKELSRVVSGGIDCDFKLNVSREQAGFAISLFNALYKGKYIDRHTRQDNVNHLVKFAKGLF